MAGDRDGEPRLGARPRTARSLGWLALLALGVVELLGYFVIQSRVVTDDEWAAAAERVRAEWREGDIIAPAPGWTDPLVRRELGDLITLAAAGRDSTDGYDRLWTISARGFLPDEAPDRAPELDEEVGRLRVMRWSLDGPRVLYRFSEHLRAARASIRTHGEDRPCGWENSGRPRGGGLGAGPIVPAERFVCDPARSWLWIGVTMQDDLDIEPRYCIWNHPQGLEPIRLTFGSVALGDELVFAGDYYYEHERNLEHGPVEVSVSLGDTPIGQMTHRDGDGWKRMVLSTHVPSRGDARAGNVTFEVRAGDPTLRTFCWSAYTREAAE
ncbi:MAG: hypothetical protein AB7S26_34020 [Sandaracinaceae bacterium]